jgi:hypothetical protein
MFGLRQSGFSQIVEGAVEYEMAISLAARIQVGIQLQLYHALVLWLTASQLWTISICLCFSHMQIEFKILEVAFPLVLASLPNTKILSVPYPAFQIFVSHRSICQIFWNVEVLE